MQFSSKLPIIDARTLGANCDECPNNGQIPVPPEIHPNPKLILLGEGPGHTEEHQRKPFVGDSGHLLNKVLKRVSISRQRCYITNATICRPKRNLSPSEWKQALECCKPRLLRELKDIPANVPILALGQKALQITTDKAKIFDWIGAPLQANPEFELRQVLPALHPAFTLRFPQWTPVLAIHADRAWKLAQGRLPVWQWPEIVTGGKRLLEVLKIIYETADHVGLDVETTDTDVFTASLLNVGIANDKYAVSVTWEDASPEEKKWVKKIVASERIKKDMHNGQFDAAIFFVQNIPLGGYDFDSMLAHAVVASRLKHALTIVSCIEFHCPRWKTEFRLTGDESGTNRFAAADPVERAEYNCKDSYIQYLLRDRLLSRITATHNGQALFQDLMVLNEYALKMKLTGMQVDASKFKRHKTSLTEKMTAARKQLFEIAKSVDAAWLPVTTKAAKATIATRKIKVVGEDTYLSIRTLRPVKASKAVTFRKIKRNGVELDVAKFNPKSNPNIRTLFIDYLGVQPRSWSEKSGNPKFDKKSLQDIVVAGGEAGKAARALLAYRQWGKLLTSYVLNLPVNPKTKKVHPSPNPSGAKTGRWSFHYPAMQTIPKTQYGKNKEIVATGLRDLFCISSEGLTDFRILLQVHDSLLGEGPSRLRLALLFKEEMERAVSLNGVSIKFETDIKWGKNWGELEDADLIKEAQSPEAGVYLVEADFKTLEATIIGLLSGDPKLLEMLKSGDIHTTTAKLLFQTETPTKQQRELAKRARYAWQYGAKSKTGWAALVVQFENLAFSTVDKLWITLSRLHPRVIAWQQKMVLMATEKDYVECPLDGRRYYFHGQVEPNKCYNLPVQMSAAALINAAMRRIIKRLPTLGIALPLNP